MKIFLHENLSYESFFTRKFSDLWYIDQYIMPMMKLLATSIILLYLWCSVVATYVELK